MAYSYTFTFQIPSFKKVNYNEEYKKYSSLTEDQQKDFIYNIISSEVLITSIFYERHKDGRLHAHGFYNSNMSKEHIQKAICLKLGIKADKQQKETFFNESCYDITAWDRYIKKDQSDEIKEIASPDAIDYAQYQFGKNAFK